MGQRLDACTRDRWRRRRRGDAEDRSDGGGCRRDLDPRVRKLDARGSSTGGTVGVARSAPHTQAIQYPVAQCPQVQRWEGGRWDQFQRRRGKRRVLADRRATGLSIVGAHTEGSTGMISYGVNPPTGVGAAGSTGKAAERRSTRRDRVQLAAIISTYFGWQIICGSSTATETTKPGEIACWDSSSRRQKTSVHRCR